MEVCRATCHPGSDRTSTLPHAGRQQGLRRLVAGVGAVGAGEHHARRSDHTSTLPHAGRQEGLRGLVAGVAAVGAGGHCARRWTLCDCTAGAPAVVRAHGHCGGDVSGGSSW
eukprot:71665-Chlamydomonas_euryale.AAC.2